MLGFAPLSTRPLDTTPAPPGPYVRPAAADVSLQFPGASYTRTSDATWSNSNEASIAATVAVVAASALDYGVSAGAVATVAISASGDLEVPFYGNTALIAAAVSVVAGAAAPHGVAATLSVGVGVAAAAEAAHGVAATAAASVGVTAGAAARHGVAVSAIGAIATKGTLSLLVERYELVGEVRLGGILVNRRVRAYRRDTGALVNEADTVAGRFCIHSGFESGIEFTVLPIDLASAATDWTPPVANRVLPELAFDA